MTFGSIRSSESAKAPTTIVEAWGRNFGALLNALIADDAAARKQQQAQAQAQQERAKVAAMSAEEQAKRDEERRNYKRRHLSPWSAASWYTVYVHQHTENRRLSALADIQSPPAIAQFNPHAVPRVAGAKAKLAEWSG